MLFGGHYKDGWANQEGSHYGVDIASAKGTPLYAIANGKVYFAGFQTGYGNVVKVQFMYNGVMYFATYAHMDQILVKTGQPVSIGQKLGTVGNSGSTFGGLGGFHVHFEIDKNIGGRPVYAFYNCKEAKKSGIETINEGLCRNEMFQYTMDPIAFLEEAKAQLPYSEPEHDAPLLEDLLPVLPLETLYPIGEENQDLSSSELTGGAGIETAAPIVTNQSLIQIDGTRLDSVGKKFLEEWDLVFTGMQTPQLKKGESVVLKLQITNKKSGQKYQGFLKQPIMLVANSTNLSIEPVAISWVENGEVAITLKALQNGPVYTAINIGLNKIGGFSSQVY